MELFDRSKKYLKFNKEEKQGILISALILGFIFAFKEWSAVNLIIAVIITGVSLLFHITAQKIAAIKVGFEAEYKVWWYGLIISLILVFVTNGRMWWLIIPGGISFSLIAGLRLGRFRYGLNYFPMGAIGLTGSIASIVLGTIFKSIDLWFFAGSNVVLNNIFIFNLAYAVSQMLPIPPLDGHFMFYASRLWYSFLLGTIAAYAFLAINFQFYSWVIAILAGALSWFVFYIAFEKTAWFS